MKKTGTVIGALLFMLLFISGCTKAIPAEEAANIMIDTMIYDQQTEAFQTNFANSEELLKDSAKYLNLKVYKTGFPDPKMPAPKMKKEHPVQRHINVCRTNRYRIINTLRAGECCGLVGRATAARPHAGSANANPAAAAPPPSPGGPRHAGPTPGGWFQLRAVQACGDCACA